MKVLKMIIPSLIFVAVSFSACKTQTCIEVQDPDCLCIQVYEPVCGCNDKTYSNSCHAECAGIPEYSDGACK
ncbi:MAG: hypothetical protein AB8H47_26895 [Bacteroidia bacterium]